MSEYRDEKYPGVTFFLDADLEDMPVRGNLIDSGDHDQDRRDEDEVIARLEHGDEWAWCVVHVTARIEATEPNEDGSFTIFEGDDYLGGCCYEDEAAFIVGGYWDDMKAQAYEALRAEVAHAIASGKAAEATMRQLPKR